MMPAVTGRWELSRMNNECWVGIWYMSWISRYLFGNSGFLILVGISEILIGKSGIFFFFL